MKLIGLLSVALFVALPSLPQINGQSAAPSPTGRGECLLQNNGWVCELPAATGAASASDNQEQPTGTAVGQAVTVTVTESIQPSPTNAGACHLHGDHWHCEDEESGSHDGHDHSHEGHSHAGHSHEGHSHAGHSHGPSDEYGCGLAPLEDYGLGLHIGSVFILLAASLAGVLIPEVMRWLRKSKPVTTDGHSNVTGMGFGPRASYVIFALRFFGGGILLSTAFVHLVAHALVYFSNSCIGELQYEATAPAIMMAAVWMMLVVNFLIMRPIRQRAASAVANAESSQRSIEGQEYGSSNSDDGGKHAGMGGNRNMVASGEESVFDVRVRLQNKLDESEIMMLEAGIIFHSIIIGVTIGTSSGAGWVAFLIAILWHQFCEGLALASRIVLLPTLGTLKIWLMYVAFCITTPLGIVIGIGVRQSYNGNDRSTLLAIGILTSISAGILLYASFIQIIMHDFFFDKRMQEASWSRAAAAIVFFTLGIIVMVSRPAFEQ